MRIAVCDDCRQDALSLKALLDGRRGAEDTFAGSHKVRLYYDAESLLDDVGRKGMQYDLYLLDIYMENSMDGIALAKRLRQADDKAAICFVSTSDGFYREAYDLYAVQYLIKPVGREALEKLLARVEEGIVRQKERFLCFTWRKAAGAVSYGQVLYISSMGNTLFIHCKNGMVQKCRDKLNELERRLDGNVFCRCHQSFLVNMYQVKSLSGMELTVEGERIPVSRRYYAEIKRRYREILFEEVE